MNARYVKNYYGTPKEYVRKQLDAGKDVILEIEIQGALKVKEEFPDTLLLFVTPPSAGELKKRLVVAETESAYVSGYLDRSSFISVPFPEPENPDTTIKIPFLFTLFPPIRYSVSVL